MPGLHRPGVYVSEVNTLGTQIPDSPDTAITVFVGPTVRGSTTVPGLVTNWNQFITLYGGFEDSSLMVPYAVWQFFNNGGASCYVMRVVGTGGVAATGVMSDRAATPQATLNITAENAGVWGNTISVQAVDRAPDRFDLIVYKGAVADLNVVERWVDLSMVATDPRYCVTLLNGVYTGSNFITLTNANSATAAPSNRPALATRTLTTGAAGSVPVLADYSTALACLDVIEQAMVINVPGQSAQTTVNAIITYAEACGDAFAVIDSSSGLSTAGVVAEAAALTQSSYAAVYYPWVNAVDPASATPGATKLLPPGASVCGIIARTDLTAGPFKAPAGLSARVSGVISLERILNTTDLDTLNDSYINAIRHHPVNGITVMGARSLNKTTPTRYVSVRRSLIYIKDNLKRISEFALFESNDATTWASINDRCSQFLTNYWGLGGLRGGSADQAFYVICDETNNTIQTINAGEVHIEVGVAVEVPAEFIVLQIGQWAGGTSAIET